MARPLYPRPGRGQEPEPAGSAWTHPYVIGALTCILALAGVIVYHFFFSGWSLEATAGGGGGGSAGSSGFFGRKFGKDGPGLEINTDELRAVGALASGSGAAGNRFAGQRAENQRDRRRLYAFAKIEGVDRRMAEERRKIEEIVNRRNSPSGQALRDAIVSIDELDNLGILKLESMLKQEVERAGSDERNLDLLIHGYQTLAESLAKKAERNPTPELQERTRDAMKQYLLLLKKASPPESAGSIEQALSDLSGPLPGPAGFGGGAPGAFSPRAPGN